MTALALAPIPSSRFTYDAVNRMLVAEASDLGGYLRRLYDDACDVGFAVRSDRTGAVAVFALSGEIREPRENELVALDFASVDGSCPVTVRVFND
jgi:hypothetical protein